MSNYGFNEQEIYTHWMKTIGIEQLADNETARLVIMPGANSNIKTHTGSFTSKKRIHNPKQLIDVLHQIQSTNPEGSVGFALSTGVFQYEYDVAPSIGKFKYTQCMTIDVDARYSGKKERFNVSLAKPQYIVFSLVNTLNYMNELLLKNGIPSITPRFVNLTGGGFQIGVKFDKLLDRDSAEKVFNTFGTILGDIKKEKTEEAEKEVKELEQITNEHSVAMFNDGGDIVLEKQKGITVPMMDDFNNLSDVFFELDNSFKDISHAQRIIGTKNQKYNADTKNIDYVLQKDKFDKFMMDLNNDINRLDVAKKSNFQKLIQKTITAYNELYKDNIKAQYTLQPSEYIIDRSQFIIKSYSNDVKKTNTTQLSYMEQKVLEKVGDYIYILLAEMQIKVVTKTARYIACSSPFREDTKPSFAIYINGGFANIIDFGDNEKYTVIDVWEKIHKVSRTTAIEEIAEICGIQLDKGMKKEFVSLQTAEDVQARIAEIDVTDKIYYRLANKSKDCIIRNIKTGESVIFDGPNMIADHVLKNQLNAKHADMELVKEFRTKFQEQILMDAFETFDPGKKTSFTKDGIKYVNTWVPSEAYRECLEISKNIDSLGIDEAIDLIRSELPTLYLYLLQLTQRGSLKYFVHWLAMVSKLNIYTATIPIFTSVEGTGKNLFAQFVLEFYLNKEYVHTVDGHAMGSNFNDFMGSANLIISDEGNYTSTKDVDRLKGLSGSDRVRVEKKGVDAKRVERKFNIMMFTNGKKPVLHTITDRRFTYFRLDHSLELTLSKLNITLDEFKERIVEERARFWAILMKTKLSPKWLQMNIKNGQYIRQIFNMHPFGELILKMVEGDWDDVLLQMNEKVRGDEEMAANTTLLSNIKDSFESGHGIRITMINKYLDAMSWKSSKSIQEYITENNLKNYGVKLTSSNGVSFHIDKEKILKLTEQENNLSELIPEFAVSEYLKSHSEAVNSTHVEAVEQNTQMTSLGGGLNVLGGEPVTQQIGSALDVQQTTEIGANPMLNLGTTTMAGTGNVPMGAPDK